MKTPRVGLAVICVGMIGVPAWAQSDAPAGTAPPPTASASSPTPASDASPQASFEYQPRWEVTAEVGLWFAAPSGKASWPAAAGGARGPNLFVRDLNMDSPRLSPAAEINLRRGDWGATVRGFSFSASDQNWTAGYSSRIGSIDFATGDVLQTSLDFAAFEIEGSYRFLDSGPKPQGSGSGWRLRATLDAVVGVRVYDIDFRVDRVSGASASTRESSIFVEPLAGVKGVLEIDDQWTVDLQTTFGGLSESFSWDIMPGFTWRPHRNFGVQIGYRQLLFRLDEGAGGLDWKGAMAGVYFGIVVRF